MSANATFLFINSKGELQPTHPETITKFVSVMVDGFVSLSCHNQVTAKLERAIRKYPGEMRMLEYIERFCGLDPLAIVPNALFNLRNHSEFERVALVTNDSLLTSTASTLVSLIATQVRTFPNTAEGKKKANDFIKEELSPSPPAEAGPK